jgi:aryl-alcohol dehydrogenase-like predicted oxidoreductase
MWKKEMKYNYFGKTGIRVSELCFGTMSFGGDADEKASQEMLHFCLDKGINFFDCANVYQNGLAEKILGRLIGSRRDEIIITSKVYFPMSEDVNACGASRKHIMNAVEASLKRLKTDHIDVYFIHRFDDRTPLEETLSALDDLVRQGKILYPGASNFSAWQTEKALGISRLHDWAVFECIQPMYNLVKRQAEVEIFPMARSENLAVIPYSPLGGGLLTGKYRKTKKPKKGRLVENKIYGTRYGADWVFETADEFVLFAQKNGYDPVSLAIAWVASHPAVTAPIIGARNLKQLKSCIDSVKIDLHNDQRLKISAFSKEPDPATDRNEEGTSHSFSVR